MDALIYTAMSGAERAMRSQQVHANNLANMDTTGFRANLAQDGTTPVAGFGYDARHLNELKDDAVSGRQGTLRQTGRELDAAVHGPGLFTVQWQDGEAYTRAGNFSVTGDGRLMLDDHPVMGEGGPITVPENTRIAVGADGSLLAQLPGQATMNPIDKLKLVKPEMGDMTKNSAGLLVPRSGGALDADYTVELNTGSLESSNVSAVEEMVATMSVNRDFEVQMKMLKAADSMAEAGNRLIRD